MSQSNQAKSKMQAAVEHFKTELKNLRSNRANPGMLDGVSVEAYGSHMRLKELANVTAPESRQLLITPFDASLCSPIAKAIEKTDLNIQPRIEGSSIRINIPPMSEEVRKQIAKQAKQKAEDAKIGIREIRRKSNETVRKEKSDGILTEDVMKKEEKTIQELTDKACKEIDDLFSQKEKEIMTV